MESERNGPTGPGGGEPPALLERVVGHLQAAGGPVGLAEIARAVLGAAAGSSAVLGAGILAPLLRRDGRFVETPGGWILGPAPGEGGPAVDGPFVALGSAGTPDAGGPFWSVLDFDAEGRETSRPGPRREPAPLAVSVRGAPDLVHAGLPAAGLAVPLAALARALAGTPARATLPDIAGRLGLAHVLEEGPAGEARIAASVWIDLRERLLEEDLLDREGVDTLLGGSRVPVPSRLPAGHLDDLPECPGVYRFLDEAGGLLYVGKSVNLRARVLSYFLGEPRDEKDRAIRDRAREIRHELLGSEPEAMLREQELIRRHRPELNVQRRVGERRLVGGDRLMVLPGPTPRRRTLLMIRGGVLAARLTVGLRREGRERGARTLREVFFGGGDEAGATAEPGTAERDGGRLLSSWIRRHPNRALWFDPGEAGGADAACDWLERYLDADPAGGPMWLRRP